MSRMISILFRRFSVFIGGFVFDRKYLQGPFFSDSSLGSKWIWRSIRWQVLGKNNCHITWPVSHFNTIVGPKENIIFSPENIDNFQGKGIYIQCEEAPVYIGKGTLIANNVGIITANHDPRDLVSHSEGKAIKIGDYSWIGMNSVILPGVEIGDHTIVGAGSVVTHSFKDGYCVIAGNPARLIRYLDKDGN